MRFYKRTWDPDEPPARPAVKSKAREREREREQSNDNPWPDYNSFVQDLRQQDLTSDEYEQAIKEYTKQHKI